LLQISTPVTRPVVNLFAPDIDACHSARRQPAGDRRQHRASAASHVEYPFVAAQTKAIQNSLPLEKLAASGRVKKAADVQEKEEEIERHLHGSANYPLPPADRRADPGGHGQNPKDHRKVRRVIAVVAASHRQRL